VSRLARETGTTVVQVGEGSDELFCGYRDYAFYIEIHNRFWRRAVKWPRALRGLVAKAGMAFHNAGGYRWLPKGRKMVPDLLRRLVEGEDLFWSGAFVFDEVNKNRLLTTAARARLNGASRNGRLSSYSIVEDDRDRLLAARPGATLLDRMIYQELKLKLSELLLMRVDKLTMATSVEARVPFLDHKLVEFAMALPDRLKYRDGVTKHILKRALRGVIPDQVIDRKKKGFGAPINEWMLDRLGAFVEHSLFNSSLVRRELFDIDYIKSILAAQRSGKVNYSFFLWSLLNLNLWYEQWIEGRPREVAALNSAGVIKAEA
jgi:asparagine synthase (glutamine-hydrolysing)